MFIKSPRKPKKYGRRESCENEPKERARLKITSRNLEPGLN